MPTSRASPTTASPSPSACWKRPASRQPPASTSTPSADTTSSASATPAPRPRCTRRWSGSGRGCDVGEIRIADMPVDVPLIAYCVGDGAPQADLSAPPVLWWSVTKTCLAACALVLVDRGRLFLDARLPDRAYTLRQLLQHTSGLGSYTERPDYRA